MISRLKEIFKRLIASRLLAILVFVIAGLYPVLVYYFLLIRNIPLRHFSLFVIAFSVLAFVAGTSSGKTFFRNSLVLLAVGILCLATDSVIILKFYPLLINILFLVVFVSTCFSPPTMIFRFAVMQDKSIKGSLGEKKTEAYCRKVTIAWCLFFFVNGSIAAWTIFYGSDELWSVYNGGISYMLIGMLFAGEFIVRKIVQKGMPKIIPLSAFKNNSRSPSAVLCYEETFSSTVFKTWNDFIEGTAKIRRHISATDSKRWLLYCEDYWCFLLAFTALLQCRKEVLLSANVSPAYIAEIRTNASMLTEEDILKLLNADPGGIAAEKVPEINADETSVIMFTSGSTGTPKEVKQRLTEFENDNSFVLSKWGGEFLDRKLCSTVNQHHIYGLLYSVLLPFTAGIPFRRKRIEFPEELEKLNDMKYMLITVPAFLKRAAEIEKKENLCSKHGLQSSPWIFSSGGVLEPLIAKKTNEIFGFWPLEVYGSTETSGIAWRQSVNGLEWMPFDNAQLSKNHDGCLVIQSPYIKEKCGFETTDMVEILEDGRFLLKGRIDSVVKIEEKRISLTEVENRILQTGLVSDVCVISLEDKRQYLAAALVFNNNGEERFLGLEKREINNFWRNYLIQYFEDVVIPKKWRYLEALPLNSQGKKMKDEIKLFFSASLERLNKDSEENSCFEPCGFTGVDIEAIVEKSENSLSLVFSVPPSSPYFDGHFPDFPILPAVAQMEIASRFSERYLGTSVAMTEIRKMKFSNIIQPSVPVLLKIEKNKNTLILNLASRDSKVVYSKGTVVPANI